MNAGTESATRPRRIGEYVKPIATWNPRASTCDTFTYIDLSAVDQQQKKITAASVISTSDSPSRARQLVRTGDVLVSTVRPNLNAVARVSSELDGATASTGFCVLRADEVNLSGAYLFHWVKTRTFIGEMTRRATSASYPAVSDAIVESSMMPMPSITEQRRIAAILDKADALRARRRTAMDHFTAVPRACFLEMFGDPITNPHGWPMHKLGKVGILDRGVSKHRPRNAPELLGGPYPLIQTGDVANCDGDIRSYSSTYSEVGLRQSRWWPAGTLCITIAANIAKTGVLCFDACFPDSVVGFTPGESVCTDYVQWWLSFLQAMLEDSAPESAQKNINLNILRTLTIPLPPMSLQRVFAARIAAVKHMRQAYREATSKHDALFAALQHHAFRGQL